MEQIRNIVEWSGFRLQYFAVTDPGCRRPHNEDAYLIDEKKLIFAVADGVGGLQGGEIASHTALREISLCLNKIKNNRQSYLELEKLTKAAIASANTAVYQYGIEHDKRTATTVSMMTLSRHHTCISNVGDSRVYLWRNNSLDQLTTDHSLKQEMIANGVLSIGGKVSSSVEHVITRAIGAAERVEIDASEHQVQENDVYLICTDGITSMLKDEEIRKTLQRMETIEQAGNALLAKAKAAGGKDNITFILLWIKAL
jgi:protein phosphatase